MILPSTPFDLSGAGASKALSQQSVSQTEALQKSATDFETAFLAEALNHMGLDVTKGVAGAEGFSSILNRAYAERLSERGGIGMSESLFRALAARAEGADK